MWKELRYWIKYWKQNWVADRQKLRSISLNWLLHSFSKYLISTFGYLTRKYLIHEKWQPKIDTPCAILLFQKMFALDLNCLFECFMVSWIWFELGKLKLFYSFKHIYSFCHTYFGIRFLLQNQSVNSKPYPFNYFTPRTSNLNVPTWEWRCVDILT